MAHFVLSSGTFLLLAALLWLGGMSVSGDSLVQHF